MGVKELTMVRTNFVYKVSQSLIKELLDDLLCDGVLTYSEKESILENQSTASSARSLIDTIRRKGDDASRKMITHLRSRDSALYSELGLSTDQPAQPGPSMKSELGPRPSAIDSSGWTKLEPVVNTVDGVQTYSLQSDAGSFECSVSALRWVCTEKISFKYQFCLWDDHMWKPLCLGYMPAGPLLDITVTAGKMEEVQLPHWIYLDPSFKMSDKFLVLHMDTSGDVVEKVFEVTSSHVRLLQPTFTPIGVLFWMKLGFPVKVYYDALIYKTNKEFLTLDVYLLPPDRALQQEVEQKQNSCGSKIILKPGPDKPMQLGNNYSLKINKTVANIQPGTRELRYDSRNVFEVFFRNADSDFTLTLESETNTIWTCTIHKGDYQSQVDKQGQHFVDRHQTALINRVTETGAILDELKDKRLISNEAYDALRALKTTHDQMREILKFVIAAGTRGKDVFYEILKKMQHLSYLISELEGSG